jgi:TMEM175 potassium channel family protein
MPSVTAHRETFKAERMIMFSDAVMAVAITLLVLDLKLPEGVSDAQLGGALQSSLHGIGVYVLSFIVVGMFWMGHHEQYSYIRRVDVPLMWINMVYLMTIGLIPFVTSLLSDHGTALSTCLYAGVLVATSLLSTLSWWYAARDPQLMPADVPESVRREGLLSTLLTAAVFALSIVIALVWSPVAGQLSWLLLIPAGRIPQMLYK